MDDEASNDRNVTIRSNVTMAETIRKVAKSTQYEGSQNRCDSKVVGLQNVVELT